VFKSGNDLEDFLKNRERFWTQFQSATPYVSPIEGASQYFEQQLMIEWFCEELDCALFRGLSPYLGIVIRRNKDDGTLLSSCFSLACNSKPDIFGMRMSTIKHAAARCKSDSRNAFADPKHCASNPPDSIRSRNESCIDSLSSMMAITLDVWPPVMPRIAYRLINHAQRWPVYRKGGGV
jgi:hypothetical protein